MMPVLFLDFDDVICLNTAYGGYDVIQALSQVQKKTAKLEDFREMWEQLFAAEAKALLRKLQDEFEPRYVLSTSWRHFMNKEAMVAALMNGGLEFVARNLHPTWSTPNFPSPQRRVREIGFWFGKVNAHERRWVVLDDERSGTGLDEWPVLQDRPCIVLCKEGVGLTEVEYQRLREAFLYRREQGKF